VVALSAPAAWASIDISIPIETRAHGLVGSEQLLATVGTGDLEGQECSVSATSENQSSIHPNNDLVVASGSTSVVLEDVEGESGGTVHADGLLTLGTTVTVTLVFGEDQVFSAGITVNIDCDEVLQAEVSVSPNECVVTEQGVPLGSVDVVITPDSGATVTLYSDAAMQDEVATFTGSGGSQDLSPGTYYWVAVAGPDYEIAGDISGNFTIEDCGPLDPETDLEITKIDLVDPVVVSTDSPTALITYEVTVSNNGPELAENVVVTDTLPASLTYVSSSPAVGSCAHVAGVVTCELGDLAVGGSVLITVVVETEAVGEVTDFSPLNVVEVTSDTEETDLENNVDDEVTNIIEVLSLTFTDLEITKIDLVDPVVVDSDDPTALITYEVTVSNLGPELAENVVVTDTLPASLTYVSSSPAVGSCAHAAGVVTCELGDLAVGDSVKITIVVETEEVGKITDTSPLNVVEVSSDTDEVNLANNVADEETNIVEVLDLVVLPFTGVDTAFMLTGAIMLLGAGLTLVLVSRRRELEI
jgi:uncharacterized repeat protein (TIGR01451 family)